MFTKNKIAAVVGLSLGLCVSGAQAATITLGLEASTNASAGAVDFSDGPNSSMTLATASSDVSDVDGDIYSNAYSNARANNTGGFYNTSGSAGNGSSSSTTKQTFNVQNGGQSQFYNFNFDVMNGSLDLSCGQDGYGGPQTEAVSPSDCTDGSTGSAQYTAEIFLNGESIWSSFASLTIFGGTVEYEATGVLLNDNYVDGQYYGWNESSFEIDLGLIDANSVFELSYIVTTKVETDVSEVSPDDIFSNYFQSYAQFGDPSYFDTSRTGNSVTAANSVNAPLTLSLLGLGLFGLVRNQKRK